VQADEAFSFYQRAQSGEGFNPFWKVATPSATRRLASWAALVAPFETQKNRRLMEKKTSPIAPMISQMINDKIGMNEIKQGSVHDVAAPSATSTRILPPTKKIHPSNIVLTADGAAAADTIPVPAPAPVTQTPASTPTQAPTSTVPPTQAPTSTLPPTQAPTPGATVELVPGGDYTCCEVCEAKGFVSVFRSVGALSGFSDVSASLGAASTTNCSAITHASERRLIAFSTTLCTNQCRLWQSKLQWWLKKTLSVADNVAQEYAYALGTDGYTSKADIATICPDDLIMR
jgi:hypothetical protein